MRRVSSIFVLAGTILILSGCASLLCGCSLSEDSDASKSHAASAKIPAKDSELEQIVFRPTKLTLSEAIKKYGGKKLRNNPKEDSEMLTKAALFAADQSDNDAAEVLLNEAIKLSDTNRDAYYLRGRVRCNGISGKDKDALNDLNKAIALGYPGPEVHLVLARLYDGEKQPRKAIEELTLAHKAAPGAKDVLKARAAIYDAIGEKENALLDYKELAKLDPESLAPYFQQGQVLEAMKKFDEACAVYKKMIKMDDSKQKVPLKALGYKRLAVVRGAQGKHEEAIGYLTEAAKFDVEDDEPLRMRGLEYMKLKNYQDAVDDFTEAILIAPETGSNFVARADAYDKLGKLALAEKDRQEAKKLNDAPAERQMFEMK